MLLIYNKKWFSNDRERKCIYVFMSESESERERGKARCDPFASEREFSLFFWVGA